MARRALILLVLAGCAPFPVREFGDRGLARERFLMLDSALASRVGQSLVVEAKAHVGSLLFPRATVDTVTRHRFRGLLLGIDSGWVTLMRLPDDTVWIGKGNIIGVYEDRRGAGLRAPLGGAAVAVAAAWLLLRQREDPSTGTQVGVISGSAIVGALLGNALFGRRRGRQLYPERSAMTRRWFGER